MTEPAISLQKRLIRNSMISSILAGLIALVLLLGFAIYQSMSTHDDLMGEISDMLLVSDLSMTSGVQVDELSREFDIYYQFKLGQKLLSQSDDFPSDLLDTPVNAHTVKPFDEHFDFVWRDGTLWRSYHYQDAARQLYVDIYQDVTERFGDFFHSFITYTLCLMLLWFLQWLFLNYGIKKQFRPIAKLSQHIAQKNADDLSPIESGQAFVELQPILKQLNLLLARVQHSLQAEQRFTADASHELRSPLSAIHMRLQLLERRYASEYPQGMEELKKIQQDVQRGIQTLENLLLLARLDPSDVGAVQPAIFEVQSLLHDVVDATHGMAMDKKILVQVSSVQDDVAFMAYANRELIFICLRNLIDNAIRYAEEQGHVYIRCGTMQGQLKSMLFIEIEDDGQQLNAEVLARMGKRFYRALGSNTQGSGLGLSICYKIVELHQGSIALSQSQWGGLKVRVELPEA